MGTTLREARERKSGAIVVTPSRYVSSCTGEDAQRLDVELLELAQYSTLIMAVPCSEVVSSAMFHTGRFKPGMADRILPLGHWATGPLTKATLLVELNMQCIVLGHTTMHNSQATHAHLCHAARPQPTVRPSPHHCSHSPYMLGRSARMYASNVLLSTVLQLRSTSSSMSSLVLTPTGSSSPSPTVRASS